MLLIIASRFAENSSFLANRCAQLDVKAEIVTPSDLSRPGWRLRTGRPQDLQAGLAGRSLSGNEIHGVINLLPWVSIHDLPHIEHGDRDYVANEMTAFLLAWLTQLQCPMLDTPTPLSLAGCGRWPDEWATLARTLDIAANPAWAGSTVDITVVDGEPIGASTTISESVKSAARMMAKAAKRSLVTLRFAPDRAHPTFINATPTPAVGLAEVADAVIARLRPR